jgi:hypothetical protein
MNESMQEQPARSRDYEFSEEQNADLRSVGSHAMVWGVVCAMVGLACMALAIAGLTGRSMGPTVGWRLYLPAGIVNTVVGANFFIAGRDFRAAVHTHGCDIPHVMQGLLHLSRAVFVQVVISLATVALVVLAVVFFGGG